MLGVEQNQESGVYLKLKPAAARKQVHEKWLSLKLERDFNRLFFGWNVYCWQYATYRIAACLVDDNPVGEGLIVGLNVQSPLLSVQRVFLDEVDIVYTCNL